MNLYTLIRSLLTVTILLVSCGSVLAQDIIRPSRIQLTDKDINLTNRLEYAPQVSVGRADLNLTGVQRFELAPTACACTNLEITVICETCDAESDEGACFGHDQACQDAAQKGGIREHKQFFCTSKEI